MSILNDDRRWSDDPEEYLAWMEEVKREYRGEDEYPEEEGDEYDEE